MAFVLQRYQERRYKPVRLINDYNEKDSFAFNHGGNIADRLRTELQ